MKKSSLRLRLIFLFTLAAGCVWIASSYFSYMRSRKYMDEFFDSYQLLMAKQLSVIDWKSIIAGDNSVENDLPPLDEKEVRGKTEGEAISFAVYNPNGTLVFSDTPEGENFIFRDSVGFYDQPVFNSGDIWRVLWLKSVDGQYTIAAGQSLKYREEAAMDLVNGSFLPWITGFFVLAVSIILLISIEFKPLRALSRSIGERSPGDLSPMEYRNAPSEIFPLITAMNKLFSKIETMLTRERAFISHAAHELRSPITAIKVQAEVAFLLQDDTETRTRIFRQLDQGIDRMARMVDQLLTLSRISMEDPMKDWQPLDLKIILKKIIEETEYFRKEKQIRIEMHMENKDPFPSGNPTLWYILLRNLIDNALRYSREKACIKIMMDADKFSIINSPVKYIDTDHSQLGEAFYRPEGQRETGSGLGLSIAKNIAQIHQCDIRFIGNRDSFSVIILPPAAIG